MLKRHLKRFNAPKNWPVKRKNIVYIARPSAGPHPVNRCLTLNILLKKILKHCKTTKEARKILGKGDVLVDKRKIKDHRFPVGFMDVIDIPKTKESYRVVFDSYGRLKLNKISSGDSNEKICKIINKKMLKKGITQLNLYGGRNIRVKKDEYKVGDSVVFNLKDKKISSVLNFKKGSPVYITDGKYVGNYGSLEEIKGDSKKGTILVKTKNKKIETLRKYVFVVDKRVFEK